MNNLQEMKFVSSGECRINSWIFIEDLKSYCVSLELFKGRWIYLIIEMVGIHTLSLCPCVNPRWNILVDRLIGATDIVCSGRCIICCRDGKRKVVASAVSVRYLPVCLSHIVFNCCVQMHVIIRHYRHCNRLMLAISNSYPSCCCVTSSIIAGCYT